MALRRRARAREHELFPGFVDVSEIGIGSLAVVYRAREMATNRLVALKLLNVRDASARAIESFERESVALGALSSHPNIVTLYRTFLTSDGRPVLVLELCAGAVSDRLHDGQGLPVQDAVSIGIKVAAALETAHRGGILHRDVKPQNLLVTEFGEPALADFGVAMLQSATQTTAGLFDFTTLHAAPELLEGGGTSAATDVYELASTLYQLIAGKSAFRAYDGESPASVILRILRDPVRPLIGTDIPVQLSDLLITAMSKDKASRPPTAAEFAAALARIEAAQGWPRTPVLIRDQPAMSVPMSPPVQPPATVAAPPMQPVPAAAAPEPAVPVPAPVQAAAQAPVQEPVQVQAQAPIVARVPPPAPPVLPPPMPPPMSPPMAPPSATPPPPAAPEPPQTPVPAQETAGRPWRTAVQIDDDTALPDSAFAEVSTRVRAPAPPPAAPPAPSAAAPPARYPIPPAAGVDTQRVPAPAVPAWGARVAPEPPPAPAAARPARTPPVLRVHSGLSRLRADEHGIRLRSGIGGTHIPWTQVSGFMPYFAEVQPSATSRGILVALTGSGPVELPATRQRAADLRELHDQLEARRQFWRLYAAG